MLDVDRSLLIFCDGASPLRVPSIIDNGFEVSCTWCCCCCCAITAAIKVDAPVISRKQMVHFSKGVAKEEPDEF